MTIRALEETASICRLTFAVFIFGLVHCLPVSRILTVASVLCPMDIET